MWISRDDEFRLSDPLRHDTIEHMNDTTTISSTTELAKRTSPFLKWAGGKGSLLPQLLPLFPINVRERRYFEPFIGGGAVFFALKPQRSFLFDINAELVEVYQTVRDNVQGIIHGLSHHYNDEAHFYKVRAQLPQDMSPEQRAARFIFLNRTCFNGLHRVNSKGQFNVPFGRYKNPKICDTPTLLNASAALQGATIEARDFADAVSSARAGDFVYFDPPYEPLSATSSFTSYSIHRFDAAEQTRLRDVVSDLSSRGCLVALSNSNAPLIRYLYQDFAINEVQARRAINSNGKGRGAITELLVTNYQPGEV